MFGNSSYFIKNKKAERLLLLFILMPLFFINIRNSHDWGGDFALYIKQGINIVEGIPQYENGYIFNEYHPYLAPPTYSVGFPLLLAPVYYFFGNNVIAFSIFITSCLIGALLTSFLLLRTYFNFIISFFTVLVIAYNPWLLLFKGEILSDIPFTLFFTLALLLYRQTDWNKPAYTKAGLIGFIIGYALLIKSIGIVLLVAFLFDSLLAIYTNRKDKKAVYLRGICILILVCTCVFVYILLSKILFPGKEDSYIFFSTLFDVKNSGDIFLKTSSYYIQILQDFFHPDNGQWNFVPLIIKAFVLSFFILGFLLTLLQKRSVIEYVFILYLIVVLSFPNTTQGFRYLFPICTLILYYVIVGLQSIQLKSTINRKILVLIIASIALLQYKHSIANIINEQHNILQGPQEPESLEAFYFISKNTPQNSVLVFNKPTVSSLYANRNSIGYRPDQEIETMEKKFKEVGVDYILTNSNMETPALNSYILKHKGSLEVIFQNQKFLLYKCK